MNFHARNSFQVMTSGTGPVPRQGTQAVDSASFIHTEGRECSRLEIRGRTGAKPVAPPSVRNDNHAQKILHEHRPQLGPVSKISEPVPLTVEYQRTYVCAVLQEGRNLASIPQDMATWHLAHPSGPSYTGNSLGRAPSPK
jgi:hypothetical protein